MSFFQSFILLSCLAVFTMASPNTRNELTCQICVDIVTDFDEWLTSDKTEQEIVDFVKEVVDQDTCNHLLTVISLT